MPTPDVPSWVRCATNVSRRPAYHRHRDDVCGHILLQLWVTYRNTGGLEPSSEANLYVLAADAATQYLRNWNHRSKLISAEPYFEAGSESADYQDEILSRMDARRQLLLVIGRLTGREKVVLLRMLAGQSGADISRALEISESRVAHYKSQIKTKLLREKPQPLCGLCQVPLCTCSNRAA